MRTLKIFLLLQMGLSISAFSSQVLEVKETKRYLYASQDRNNPLKKRTAVCIFQGDTVLECGNIVRANSKKVLVKLRKSNSKVKVGDSVIADNHQASKPRRPASISTSETKIQNKSHTNDHFSLAMGLNFGLRHFTPLIHFQSAFTQHFALGIKPLLLRSSDGVNSLNAYGSFFTFHYFRDRPFEGLWLQSGIGYYAFSAKTATAEQEQSSIALLGTVGWRQKWNWGLNLAAGAGFQYITPPNQIDIVTVEFSSLQVSANVEVGFTF